MQQITTVRTLVILTFSWIHLTNSDNSTHRKVIIIGAGSAGIASATRLLDNGVDDILVLEAQSRIGGRIHSIPFPTSYVDLGAEWAQQDEDSIVYSLAKSYDILREAPSIKTHMMHSDGTCIDTKYARELTNFYASLKSDFTSKEEEYMSVGEVFLNRYDSVLEKYQSDPEALKICLDAINTFQNMVNVRQGSFSWFEPALFTSSEAPKGKMLNWNGFGFKTILDIMMKKYPGSEAKSPVDDKIIFNKEVIKIDWSGHSNKVKCDDGSEFSSDYVIFTPSVGFLKAKHDEMFNPRLPEEKVIALNNIGFGSLMKIFLHFPEKWWSDEFEGIILVWRQEDLNNLVEEFPHGPMKDNKSWISNAYSLTLAENNPNTIIAWFGGNFIPDLETTSDNVIQEGVLYLFRKFYGKSYNITLPDKMTYTSWYKDPYARGVYSFESVECRSLDFNCNEALASPLLGSEGNPMVFFAGEATNPHHYGTVRGAIATGYDVADYIINNIKK